MSELGRLLAETRTANDLSLADVEAATRVRQKYLEALEQGNYRALPPGSIARGFLRIYARYLGLDDAGMLQLYADETGDNGPFVPRSDPNGGRPIDYRPLEVSLMREDGGSSAWRWVIALIVVAALVAGAWWVLNHPGAVSLAAPSQWVAALGPQRTNTPTAAATRTRIVIVVTVTPPEAPPSNAVAVGLAPGAPGSATTAQESTAPTPTSDLLTLPIPTVQPTATNTPTPRPTATPEPSAGISLTLKTTQRAWTKITSDGQVIMQDLLEAGQERGFGATQQMIVLTGNAGGVILTLNNENLGTMGNVGQVVERGWKVQDGQVAEMKPEERNPVTNTVASTTEQAAPAPALPAATPAATP